MSDLRLKKTSAQDIADYALMVEDTFLKFGVGIPPSSEIGRIISFGKEYSESLRIGTDQSSWGQDKYREIMSGVLQLQIIASVVKFAGHRPEIQPMLRKLMKGSVDPTSIEHSKAKDFMFELQMLSLLDSGKINSELKEPDIVFELQGQQYAMACKTLYKSNNQSRSLENQLRKAKRQISISGLHGVVALAIQFVVRDRRLFLSSSEPDFGRIVSSESERFLKRYEDVIFRTLGGTKIFGVLLLHTTLVQLESEKIFASAQYLLGRNLCSLQSQYMHVLNELEDKLLARRF